MQTTRHHQQFSHTNQLHFHDKSEFSAYCSHWILSIAAVWLSPWISAQSLAVGDSVSGNCRAEGGEEEEAPSSSSGWQQQAEGADGLTAEAGGAAAAAGDVNNEQRGRRPRRSTDFSVYHHKLVPFLSHFHCRTWPARCCLSTHVMTYSRSLFTTQQDNTRSSTPISYSGPLRAGMSCLLNTRINCCTTGLPSGQLRCGCRKYSLAALRNTSCSAMPSLASRAAATP